jgi:hypothetical protein
MKTMENRAIMGKDGQRSMFHIKKAVGVDICDYSWYEKQESEVLIPPGAYFKILRHWKEKSSLYIIEMEQRPPPEDVSDLNFDDVDKFECPGQMESPLVGAAPLTVGLAVAFCFDGPIHVEWSTPYCLDPHSGPAYAHYGFPIPYQRFSGISSMLYLFQPLAYAFNLLVLSVPTAVLAHRLPSRLLGAPCVLAVPWNGLRVGSLVLPFGTTPEVPPATTLGQGEGGSRAQRRQTQSGGGPDWRSNNGMREGHLDGPEAGEVHPLERDFHRADGVVAEGIVDVKEEVVTPSEGAVPATLRAHRARERHPEMLKRAAPAVLVDGEVL